MESISSVVSGVIILFVPLLGPMGYNFRSVENIVIRLLLVLYITLSANVGYMSGLLSFLAVYSILIERNHEALMTYKVIKEKHYEIMREEHCEAVAKMKQPPYFERVVMDPRTTQQEKNAASANFQNAEDLKDNIPRMDPAPLTNDAPKFYRDNKLL